MANRSQISEAFDKGKGILRLVPNFIPRGFGRAGRRLRLHPDDYYTFGVECGTIKERWFCSIATVNIGIEADAHRGMSYVAPSNDPEEKFLFKDAVDELGAALIGQQLKREFGTWPMFAKFFDYMNPLFHHLHLDHEAAARVGMVGKPESYYFPPQLNDHLGLFPATYFGLDPDTTIEQVRQRLEQFESTDNRITELSRAYQTVLGTGWYTPAGVLHAPASVLTYEPQCNSDVYAIFQNVVDDETFDYEFLVGCCPAERKRDMDYILSLLDWERNVDPHYKKNYFRPPIVCPHSDERHTEKWISYANDGYFGAKELTVHPGQTVTAVDPAAYGCIVVQGHGTFGAHDVEAAAALRFGQLSGDEYFVSEDAGRDGVPITNQSPWEPMVILKHFGPNHPDMPETADN